MKTGLDARSPAPPSLPDGQPWPRISVITPSFNQGAYLEETLQSVLEQGYPDVEHIVIDGGSSDNTIEILKRYDAELAYWVSEKDRGQSHAINKGFARATGSIVTWLNSDDAFVPGALFGAALAFHRSGADMVAGVVELHREGERVGRHLTSCGPGPLPLEDLLDLDNCWNGGQFFYQPEVLFTRDLWERAGGHVSEEWHYSMDYELWLRFAAAGATLQVIGRPMVRFRLHEEQKTADRAFMEELPRARDVFLEQRGLAFQPPPKRSTRDHLRIALVNDVGYSFGAGIGHRRVAQALRAAGHEVVPLQLRLPDLPRWSPEEITAALKRRLSVVRPDLVVFGNLHAAYVDAALVREVTNRVPGAILLHDLWWATGWCVYPGPCDGHRAACRATCRTPYDYPRYAPQDIAEACRQRRALLAAPHGPVPWANSRWTADFVRAAVPELDAVPAVPLGLDLEVFRPRDPGRCREALGLPRDAFILMTSAVELWDPRKGVTLLKEALELLQDPEILVVAPGDVPRGGPPPIASMRCLGYLAQPEDMARVYGAADVFVGPSRDEALGMTFLEAAACGVPSIGFPVGGVPEALADGCSGVLAADVSAAALAAAIARLRDDPELRRRLGAWGRLWAENQWSVDSAANGVTRALWETGLAERLSLGRKLRLVPHRSAAPEPIYLFEPLGAKQVLRNLKMLRMEALRWGLRAWRALPLEPRMRFREGVERLLGRRIRPPW